MANDKIQISPSGESSTKPKAESSSSGGSSFLSGIMGGGDSSSGSSGGGGGGMGSSWSWIADIVAVVGSTTTSVLGYDIANRKYKYDLMNPLPVKSQQNTMMILLIAGAVLIMTIMIIYAVKSPNESRNVGS